MCEILDRIENRGKKEGIRMDREMEQHISKLIVLLSHDGSLQEIEKLEKIRHIASSFSKIQSHIERHTFHFSLAGSSAFFAPSDGFFEKPPNTGHPAVPFPAAFFLSFPDEILSLREPEAFP